MSIMVEALSYMSIPTSTAVESGAPMQKLDHSFVEQNVPVEGPIDRKLEANKLIYPIQIRSFQHMIKDYNNKTTEKFLLPRVI